MEALGREAKKGEREREMQLVGFKQAMADAQRIGKKYRCPREKYAPLVTVNRKNADAFETVRTASFFNVPIYKVSKNG